MKFAYILLGALVFPMACKTTSQGGSSKLNAWEIDGNKEAAHTFILATIHRYYPDVAKKDPGVQAFALALQDQKTKQTESSDYVLEHYWQQSQGKAPGRQTPIEQYIVQEFLILTNYLQVASKESPKLLFLGDTRTVQGGGAQ